MNDSDKKEKKKKKCRVYAGEGVGMVKWIVKIVKINNWYVAHMRGGDKEKDGRRDASEEGRPMGNQYVSTTHPKSWGMQTSATNPFSWGKRTEGKKKRERKKKKVRGQNLV